MRTRFRELHASGTFVIPNPWDVGSATILVGLGFPALATTSSGHAMSLGRTDGEVTRDELVDHVATLVRAVDVPVHVDAERCFADTLAGVAETVDLLAGAGAAGLSIEDWDRATGDVDPIDVATARVGAAVEAAKRHDMVVTARAENHIRNRPDLDDTITRLQSYRDQGAEVLYAPGLVDLDEIARLVREVAAPVNVLARPDGPTVGQLASVGVRRISTGGALARTSYDALRRAGRELHDEGTSTYAVR
jgi:2-methylisocitrate lyase-like PEP mutase family enzyme